MPNRFVAPRSLMSLEDAAKAFRVVQEQLDALSRSQADTAVRISSFTPFVPSFTRVSPQTSAGLRITMPRPGAENVGLPVIFNIEDPKGPVTVEAPPGVTINGLETAGYATAGLLIFYSNGVDAWNSQNELPTTSPGGAALDANYVLGAAHGSLPNAGVGTDTPEINFQFIPAGIATWILNTASVAFSKLADLTGLSVLGRAATTTGVMAAITSTARRQVLQNNDAGNGLQWGFPVEMRDNANVDQGDVYSIQVVNGLNTTSSVVFAADRATIGWSVDNLPLSALEDIPANTFVMNPTALAAAPQAVAGSTVAGAGLTYTTGGSLAVGAGTGLTVNANDVQLSTIAAESFFGNFTAGAAVPTARAGSSVAGAGLTYTAGGTLAVGAGTNVTVNANDVSVTNFPLSGLATQNARTVVANATNASAAPTAVQGTTARHVFRVNDLGTALEWGFATLNIEDDNVAEGSAHTLDFQSGNGVDMGVLISAGEAVITPSLAFAPAATAGGLLHFFYTFDTSTTMADPGSGDVRFNSATPSSVTQFVIDDVDENGIDVGGGLSQSPFSWGRLINAYVTFRSRANPFKFATYRTTTGNDQAAYWDATCVHIDSNGGNFTDGEQIDVFVTPNGNNTFLAPVALDADMEAGTSLALVVPPGRQHRHPSAAKFWAMATVAAGVPTLQASYNVTSITDTAAGRLTVNIGTDFSSANWCAVASTFGGTTAGAIGVCNINAIAAGTVEVGNRTTAPALADPVGWHVAGFGDQ